MRKLVFVSFTCLLFAIIVAIGGIVSGSLSILVDSAHMLSDIAQFMLSYFAVAISQKKSSFTYSLGFHRTEVIGALASVIIIWFLLIWFNIEAT